MHFAIAFVSAVFIFNHDAVAQSEWTGAVSTQFSDGGNWNGGAPGTGDAAVISSGTAGVDSARTVNTLGVNGGGHLSVNAADLAVTNGTTLSGSGSVDISTGRTLDSAVTMTGGTLSSSGTVTGPVAVSVGTLTNNGTATIIGKVTIANAGVVNNSGTLNTVDNQATGTLTNNTGAKTGSLSNSGAVSNAGTIASLSNSGGTFTNNGGGTVTGATVITGGTVTNNDTLGTVDNQSGGTLTNNTGAKTGSLSNAGTASNAGAVASLNNSGGTFTNNGGGTVTGATVITGGTVTNNDTLASVDNQSGGIFNNNTGAVTGAFSNAGVASSAGTIASLTNSGGSFTNNSGGKVTGATVITGGTVTNNDVFASVDNAAGGTFTNNTGATAGAVSNAGVASSAGTIASLINSGGSFTNAMGGTVTGATVVTGGTVTNTATLASVDNQATGTFVNTTGATVGTVTNAGTASNAGTVTSLVNTGGTFVNSGTITTTATVTGGTLVNNGAVIGGVEIYTGGLLQGTGTVGFITINAGATVTPAETAGTLAVDGDVVFASGSTYQVDVTASGASDTIVSSGAVVINGGTVAISTTAGTYTPLTSYTILTATGGITGTFDSIASSFDMAFLTPTLSYDPNDVFLTLARNGVAFADVGWTFNERSVGTAVQGLGTGNAIYDAVLPLNVANAVDAFQQLDGEIHASSRTMLLNDSQFIRNAVGARMAGQVGAVAGNRVDPDGLSVWVKGTRGSGRFDGNSNASGLDRDTTGIVAGADAHVFDTWRLGVATGYEHSSYDVDASRSHGSADTYHAAVYAASDRGSFSVRTGAAYSWNDLSTRRNVVFTGFSDTVSASYRGETAQIFGEAAYRIDTSVVDFEPFANLAYVNLHTDGFNEHGGAAALTGASGSDDVTFAVIGMRVAREFDLQPVNVKLHGMLGWRQAFGDLTPSSTLKFAGGDAFEIGGVAVARQAALVEAGVDLALSPLAALTVSYTGEFGKSLQNNGVNVGLSVKF